MGRELLYSNGYANPYTTAQEEVAASSRSEWYPSSVDFKATADASGGGSAVTNMQDVLKFIGSKDDGSITELGIIGHANANYFAFGGTITKRTDPIGANVTFNRAMLMDPSGLDANSEKIKEIKKKFAPNAKLVLYGCHAGLDDSLMKKLATTFGICVYGFSLEIVTGFLTSGSGKAFRISERGRVYVDTNGFLAAGLGPPVSSWEKDVHNLKPNKKSADTCPDY